MQGASAVARLLHTSKDPNIRVLVNWEPVIATDLRSPSSRVLARISDLRARQYWDRERLLSKAMGEKDRATIVWDVIKVYDPAARWNDRLPEPVFSDRPVVRVIDEAARALSFDSGEVTRRTWSVATRAGGGAGWQPTRSLTSCPTKLTDDKLHVPGVMRAGRYMRSTHVTLHLFDTRAVLRSHVVRLTGIFIQAV